MCCFFVFLLTGQGLLIIFFFFSSRRRHTRFKCDWSSDVCSSDLDAARHALVPIGVRPQDLEAMLVGAEFAMGGPAPPQVLITIAARFGRVAWKYSAVAYQLILKDVGVLTQTLYLMATDMGLGGCAIGSTNIDLFAKMTGIKFHVEGPVGQFALGRPAKSGVSELEHVVLC